MRGGVTFWQTRPAWKGVHRWLDLLTHSRLMILLTFQSVVSLGLLHNTAFQDEALYLYAGRQLFNYWLKGGAAPTEAYEQFFSGHPLGYPLVAGGLDELFGLEGVRLLSLVCMLGVTAVVYRLTRQLFGERSALVAAAIFSCQGPVLLLSRLATYDAPSLGLLALSTLLALQPTPRPRLTGLTLLLAVLIKYAALLFVPTILFLLVWQTARQGGWRQGLRNLEAALAIMVGGVLVVLAGPNLNILTGLNTTTTDRTALVQASRLVLSGQIGQLAGIVGLLGLVGAVSLRSGEPKVSRVMLRLTLLGTALLPVAYHVIKAEPVSLHKHLAFGLFFVTPLVGRAVAGLSQGRRWPMALAVCLVLFGSGLSQAQGFYQEWPSSENLTRVLLTQVRPGSGRILAEESEVPRYYLQDTVAYWQWSHLYWFEYTDAQNHKLNGLAAYRTALEEGYFDLVVLRYGFNASQALAMGDGLLPKDTNDNHSRYQLIAKVPFNTSFGVGYYWVWHKVSS